MQAPGGIRFLYETLRYAMVARGLRFTSTPLPPGSVVQTLSYLDGQPLYEKLKAKAAKQAIQTPQAGKAETDDDPHLAVFLHGLGSSLTTWSNVLPGIARRVPTVAPDLPGFGRTPPPQDAPFATLREHVDAAHQFIDAVSPDAPVQLVGQSLGGWIAARVAAERPRRIARLTLANATGIHHPQILEQRRLFSPHDEEELTELWRRMWHRLPTSFRLLKKQFLELTRTPVVRGFMDTVQEEDFLVPSNLSRIEAPTLLVWGMDDQLIDYEFASVYRAHVGDIRFRPIPACGHVPQGETPRMFLHYVLPWMLGREPPEPDRPGLRAAEDEFMERPRMRRKTPRHERRQHQRVQSGGT